MKTVRYKHLNEVGYGILKDENISVLNSAPWFEGIETGVTIPLHSATLLAPCEPGKIICLAINFPGATGIPENFSEPLAFLKPSTSVIGHLDTICSPFKDTDVWGESELGIVIGKKLKNVESVEIAHQGIFGYTIGNDVSASNVQGWDHHLARSKAADTFCSLGPWIDTDFDPQGKYIRGYHNGLLLRQGIASERLWAEPELIVWLSKWLTLEPGDVILTGAPTRVRNRIFLSNGDTFICEVEGLGRLENPFTYNPEI